MTDRYFRTARKLNAEIRSIKGQRRRLATDPSLNSVTRSRADRELKDQLRILSQQRQALALSRYEMFGLLLVVMPYLLAYWIFGRAALAPTLFVTAVILAALVVRQRRRQHFQDEASRADDD